MIVRTKCEHCDAVTETDAFLRYTGDAEPAPAAESLLTPYQLVSLMHDSTCRVCGRAKRHISLDAYLELLGAFQNGDAGVLRDPGGPA